MYDPNNPSTMYGRAVRFLGKAHCSTPTEVLRAVAAEPPTVPHDVDPQVYYTTLDIVACMGGYHLPRFDYDEFRGYTPEDTLRSLAKEYLHA